MTAFPSTRARHTPVVPLAVKKAFAAIVIVFCLSIQVTVILRGSEGRFWPFVDYPMFSQAAWMGTRFDMWELRARACVEPFQTWTVKPRTLGYGVWVYRDRLREIAEDRPSASQYRDDLNKIAGSGAISGACALQVWERTVRITRHGYEPAAADPRWIARREWSVDDAASVRVLTITPAGTRRPD